MNVLIVNSILIGDDNATGTTMKNMLLGIPDVNYLQYCIDYRTEAHVQLVDTIFMSREDAWIDKFIYKVRKKKLTNKVTTSGIPSVTKGKKDSVIGEFLHGVVDSWPCRISDNNREIIEEFHPDLIYTMGGSIRVLKQSIILSKKYNIPIVFHCMDDWRSVIYTTSVLSKVFHMITQKTLKELHKRTICNLAICKKMAELYTKEYCKDYKYASNCLFEFANKNYCPDDKDNFTIIFSGGLHFNRGKSLRLVAEIIEDLNFKGINIQFEIFAPQSQVEYYREYYNDLYHTKLQPYVKKEYQLENLMRADLLLHVESFEPKDIQYMKYSFSTKLVEYFAAGRAVLGYGAEAMSSISYIKEMNCGYTAESEQDLILALKLAKENILQTSFFADNALEVAQKHHSQIKVQSEIKEVLNKTYELWRQKY